MAAKLPLDTPKRTHLTAFYITEDDYQFLRRVAHDGGFRSPSHLVAALIEPILQGSFSLMSFYRSCTRLQRHMERNGVRFWVDSSSLEQLPFFGKPNPQIPEEPITKDQLEQDFVHLLQLLEEQETPQTTTTGKPNKPQP